MDIGRALKVRDACTLRLRDLYSAASSYGLDHATLNERRRAIYYAMPKGTPFWVRSYLDGIADQLMQDCYQYRLVFGGKIGDTFYSTHSNRPDYYEKNGIEPSAYADDGLVRERGHYWAESLRPFFIDHK
jgi:hypothetical protein